MKTADLIRRLQEADPTGELECVAGGEDVYFVQRLPMYYDGWPHVSYYPAKGGDGFGNNYYGTGDSVLKKGWWE